MKPKRYAASLFAIASRALQAFVRCQAGVTALEYALLGSLIAAVAAAGIGTLSGKVQAMWAVVSNAVVAAM